MVANIDRRRNLRLKTRPARSWLRNPKRYARTCRNDRKLRYQDSLDCRCRYGIRRTQHDRSNRCAIPPQQCSNLAHRGSDTKRCGHLGGKQIVRIEVFATRITAAVLERKRLGSDIVIIARTDALQTHNFNEAIRRLKAAIQAGADVAFLEGVTTEDEPREACRLLAPTPLLLNMVEHGATPSWTPEKAKQLGFKIYHFPVRYYSSSIRGYS